MTQLQTIISQAIQRAPSGDNTQPWHISWENNNLRISYDAVRNKNKTFPADSPATLLTMGATLENMKQAAKALNIDLTYEIKQTLESFSPVYFQAKFAHIKEMPVISTNSIPLFKRHTNRFAYSPKEVPEETIQVLKKLTQGSSRVVIINQKQAIKQIADLVRKASEIRFQTKEVHEWLAKSLRFGTKDDENDGLDIATLDLPPGGKAFLRLISDWNRMKLLNHFGTYKALSIIDSRPIKQAPAIVAIISPSGFHNILEAGQLMNRIWIDLNNKGLAVHPYYVISDQVHRLQADLIPSGLKSQARSIQNSVNEIFQLREGENLQMLFRVGYPMKTPALSKRLPLETICSGIDFNFEN